MLSRSALSTTTSRSRNAGPGRRRLDRVIYATGYITTKPDQLRSKRGGALLTAENATPSGRLEVVPTDGYSV